MNAVCPACRVPVVAGYVRCPKCHAALPQAGSRGRPAYGEAGGTALSERRFPASAVLVALITVAAVVLVVRLRSTDKKLEAAPAPTLPDPEAAVPRTAPATTTAPAPGLAPGPAPAAPDPSVAIRELESELRRQRLWGRAEITAGRVDLRSGSCGDPAMRPAVEGQRSLLRSAGLTKLRCVEQSGAVVFERELGP